MSDLRNSQMHNQMLALARIQKKRRLRYWLNAVHVAMLLFFADQILKTWVLRQLAPGDQIQFLGQSYLVLTHLSTGLDNFVLYVFEWVLWLTVAVVFVLRYADAESTEIMSATTLLVAGVSNGITRAMLGSGLNVFGLQGGSVGVWLSFNLAHVVIATSAFLLTASWLRALWPESLAEYPPSASARQALGDGPGGGPVAP